MVMFMMNILNILKHLNGRGYNSNPLRMAKSTTKHFVFKQLYSKTIVFRFARYLMYKNYKSHELSRSQSSYSNSLVNVKVDQVDGNVLRKMSNDQLVDFVLNINLYIPKANILRFVRNDLDLECSRRIRQLDVYEILRLLYEISFIVQGRLASSTFYRNSMEILVEDFSKSKSADNFVQICFFLGMWKKTRHTDLLMTKFIDENFSQYLHTISSFGRYV